jgi:hypothetical protein
MFKKIASLTLVCALVCALSGTPAFAQTLPVPDAKLNQVIVPPDSVSAGKKEAQPNGSLKTEISKLVADAKAGKGLLVSDPQTQPRQSNGLSKGAKIAIVAGIATAVILIVSFIHVRNHLFDF